MLSLVSLSQFEETRPHSARIVGRILNTPTMLCRSTVLYEAERRSFKICRKTGGTRTLGSSRYYPNFSINLSILSATSCGGLRVALVQFSQADAVQHEAWAFLRPQFIRYTFSINVSPVLRMTTKDSQRLTYVGYRAWVSRFIGITKGDMRYHHLSSQPFFTW